MSLDIIVSQLTCIFCLQDDNKIITYQGSCDCHPLIHEECIIKWNRININKCPICLKNNNYVTIVYNSRTINISRVLCIVCCIFTCLTPYIIFAILLSMSIEHTANSMQYNKTM